MHAPNRLQSSVFCMKTALKPVDDYLHRILAPTESSLYHDATTDLTAFELYGGPGPSVPITSIPLTDYTAAWQYTAGNPRRGYTLPSTPDDEYMSMPKRTDIDIVRTHPGAILVNNEILYEGLSTRVTIYQQHKAHAAWHMSFASESAALFDVVLTFTFDHHVQTGIVTVTEKLAYPETFHLVHVASTKPPHSKGWNNRRLGMEEVVTGEAGGTRDKELEMFVALLAPDGADIRFLVPKEIDGRVGTAMNRFKMWAARNSSGTQV